MTKTVTIIGLTFPPDMGGGATRALNIARCLVDDGYEVRVVSSVPHYPSGLPWRRSLRLYREDMGKIQILRLPTPGLPHKGMLNRLIIFSWFALVSLLALQFCRGSSRIISLWPHPFIHFTSYLAKIATGSKLIVDVPDLWPEEISLDNQLANSFLQAVGYCLNTIVYRIISDEIFVSNEPILNFLRNRYGFRESAFIAYNAVDTESFTYDESMKNRKQNLRKLLGKSVEGKFVVLYHGVVGPYQALERIVDAASIHEGQSEEILYIIIGDGERKESVLEYAKTKGNQNIIFLPYMHRSKINRIVAESDLGIVPVVSDQDTLMRILLPSKSIEFLATGTPILAPKGSFIGSMATKFQAGYEVDFREPLSICSAVEEARSSKETYRSMARHARQLAVDLFSLDRLKLTLKDAIEN